MDPETKGLECNNNQPLTSDGSSHSHSDRSDGRAFDVIATEPTSS